MYLHCAIPGPMDEFVGRLYDACNVDLGVSGGFFSGGRCQIGGQFVGSRRLKVHAVLRVLGFCHEGAVSDGGLVVAL